MRWRASTESVRGAPGNRCPYRKRVTQHGRQRIPVQSIAHSAARGLRAAFVRMTQFSREVQNAPQLTEVERWGRILGYALRKYLKGRVPDPPRGLLLA